MTITDMAKQLNVSTMTIYRRCKKSGVKLDELRDASNGRLTSEGVAIIASLFDATMPQMAVTDDATQLQPDHNSETQPTPQGASTSDMAVQVAALTATVDGMRVLIEQLTSERDALREQVAALTAALQAEQADRQHERRLLTGGQDAGSRRRWRWPWERR